MVGPCSQQRGWFSESPPRQKPCVCSHVCTHLVQGQKAEFSVQGSEHRPWHNLKQHLRAPLTCDWPILEPDVSWEMLGPFPHRHITVSSWACLWPAAGISAWSLPRPVFKDEKGYRQKGKVCPSRQADILCGSWTVSNVTHCLEGSLLSISVWGELLQLSQHGTLGTRATVPPSLPGQLYAPEENHLPTSQMLIPELKL